MEKNEEKFKVWIELISEENDLKEGIKNFEHINKMLKDQGWMTNPLTFSKDANLSVAKVNEGIMIDTVPLPEKPQKGLMIGSWPTPEKNLILKFWPSSDKFGIVPVPDKSFNKEFLNKITANAPRLNINIPGGIRNAHIHLSDGIALLNKQEFKDYVGELAKQFAINVVDELY